MKKQILCAGFLLLAAVLFSFSSFAYSVNYNDDSPRSGVSVTIEVIGGQGFIGDIDLDNPASRDYVLIVDAYAGDNIPVILLPGDYTLRCIGPGGDFESGITISSQPQPGGTIGVLYLSGGARLVVKYSN